LWNEPDFATYWYPQDGLKTYALLLKDVYTTAKREDPGCTFLNGGLAQGISSVNRLYDAGCNGYFDALNIHIFENPLDKTAISRVRATVKTVRKIMVRNGDEAKPLWITEIGAPGIRRGRTVPPWWQGTNPTEKAQGRWVREVYRELLGHPYVQCVFWAFFRDTKHWGNGIDYFGLVRRDYSQKPGFREYRKRVSEYRQSLKESVSRARGD
jgi:polysaccharide biosynthesis protein PslG